MLLRKLYNSLPYEQVELLPCPTHVRSYNYINHETDQNKWVDAQIVHELWDA